MMTFAAAALQHGLRAVLAMPLFMLAAALPADIAQAGASINLNPIVAEIAPDASGAAYRVTNQGEEPVTLQVTARRWMQDGAEEWYTSAEDLLIAPAMLAIASGETRIVRIAPRKRDASREQAYRVTFTEVLTDDAAPGAAARTYLVLDVPLFFQAKDAQAALALIATPLPGGELSIVLRNHGSGYARLSSARLVDGENRELARLPGSYYVLAGAAREWRIPDAAVRTIHGLRLMPARTDDNSALPIIVR